jgi:hypothetical protein
MPQSRGCGARRGGITLQNVRYRRETAGMRIAAIFFRGNEQGSLEAGRAVRAMVAEHESMLDEIPRPAAAD